MYPKKTNNNHEKDLDYIIKDVHFLLVAFRYDENDIFDKILVARQVECHSFW